MSMSGRMAMSEPIRRLELFTGAGRRRTGSDEEKAAIVAESVGPAPRQCGGAPTWIERLAAVHVAAPGAYPHAEGRLMGCVASR